MNLTINNVFKRFTWYKKKKQIKKIKNSIWFSWISNYSIIPTEIFYSDSRFSR